MKSLLISIILHISALVCLANNQEAYDAASVFAAENGVKPQAIAKGLKGGVWKSDNSSVAICFHREQSSLCIVVYKSADVFKISDVSKVESGNFAKLGFKRSHYDKFITEPTKWNETGRFIYTNFNGRARHQITFRTRAWRGGQRYTVEEPLILNASWKPLWR